MLGPPEVIWRTSSAMAPGSSRICHASSSTISMLAVPANQPSPASSQSTSPCTVPSGTGQVPAHSPPELDDAAAPVVDVVDVVLLDVEPTFECSPSSEQAARASAPQTEPKWKKAL